MQRRGLRRVLPDVLSAEECAELTFIHRGLSSAGYSPHLWTSKLADVAYAEPALLLPLVAARDKAVTAAEQALGHPFELCVEFTGLVSWTKGASIEWHHDSNRPHLYQRHATAVLYLNDSEDGQQFSGGVLEFADGSPLQVEPQKGSVVAFLSDDSNTHRVTPVQSGERLTLTLWFTLQPEHSEDAFVLKQLQPGYYGRQRPETLFQDQGCDIRGMRLSAAGFHADQQSSGQEASDVALTLHPLTDRQSDDVAYEKQSGVEFVNLQHALLAVAFGQWRLHGQEQQPGCCGSSRQQLRSAKSALNAYLGRLKAQLPEAVAEWRQAGLIFDTAASH